MGMDVSFPLKFIENTKLPNMAKFMNVSHRKTPYLAMADVPFCVEFLENSKVGNTAEFPNVCNKFEEAASVNTMQREERN